MTGLIRKRLLFGCSIGLTQCWRCLEMEIIEYMDDHDVCSRCECETGKEGA